MIREKRGVCGRRVPFCSSVSQGGFSSWFITFYLTFTYCHGCHHFEGQYVTVLKRNVKKVPGRHISPEPCPLLFRHGRVGPGQKGGTQASSSVKHPLAEGPYQCPSRNSPPPASHALPAKSILDIRRFWGILHRS